MCQVDKIKTKQYILPRKTPCQIPASTRVCTQRMCTFAGMQHTHTNKFVLGKVMNTCNPSTGEAKVGGRQQNTRSPPNVCIIFIHQCQHTMNVCLPCLLLNLMVYYLISGLRKATRRAEEEMSNGFIFSPDGFL